uniref:Uncharacterized protein n=1 Tax=Candidatus Kentrum eta TaxID=2126337 RepID=A0A450UUP8_9GAMM|nr:MAG: hypothetical protein BECKH772A_GA0070896_1000524 [Candidatus Kentron sp. H]VFJ89524.1 MAG: hypothetical protein BECKH772B_GA0070898_1000524 [Candidatus Kentron sp. H]VFJ96216.1 MAG: hypothetical protein BECKH772C_GA0070978_1000524 [Candidatus Kentron sp. H]
MTRSVNISLTDRASRQGEFILPKKYIRNSSLYEIPVTRCLPRLIGVYYPLKTDEYDSSATGIARFPTVYRLRTNSLWGSRIYQQTFVGTYSKGNYIESPFFRHPLGVDTCGFTPLHPSVNSDSNQVPDW